MDPKVRNKLAAMIRQIDADITDLVNAANENDEATDTWFTVCLARLSIESKVLLKHVEGPR